MVRHPSIFCGVSGEIRCGIIRPSANTRKSKQDWSSIPEPVPYANLTNPQTLNLYAMAQDDPQSFADLDGHQGSNNGNSSDNHQDCNVYTGNGCDEFELRFLDAATSGATGGLGVLSPDQAFAMLDALIDFTNNPQAKDDPLADPDTAKEQQSQQVQAAVKNQNCAFFCRLFHTDSVPAGFVILNGKTQDEGSFSFFYYQLENKEGQKLTGDGYGVEEHISPDKGVNTSEGSFVPARAGVSRDIVGYADFSSGEPRSMTFPSTAYGGATVFQTFTVSHNGQAYNLTTVFVHDTVVLGGAVFNNVTDLAP